MSHPPRPRDSAIPTFEEGAAGAFGTDLRELAADIEETGDPEAIAKALRIIAAHHDGEEFPDGCRTREWHVTYPDSIEPPDDYVTMEEIHRDRDDSRRGGLLTRLFAWF